MILFCSLALSIAATLGILNLKVERDPFVNVFLEAWRADWREGVLRGDILDYQAPISVRDYPDLDWGAQSVHYEIALPLDDAMIGVGSGGENQLSLYCYKQSIDAIAAIIDDIPESNMPSEIFAKALQQTAAHSTREAVTYIQQCYTTVKPRGFDNVQTVSSSQPDLLDRCAAEVAQRFGTVGELRYDPDRLNAYRLTVAPISINAGTALGALCKQSTHPSGVAHFYTWYMPEPG